MGLRIVLSEYWNRYHLPLIISIRDDKESTAWGAYLIARTGMGDFASVDEAYRSLLQHDAETVYLPDAAKHGLYEQKRTRINAFYQISNI